MNTFNARAFNIQPAPRGQQVGFDPQPEPPRPAPTTLAGVTPMPVGLLLPAVQA